MGTYGYVRIVQFRGWVCNIYLCQSRQVNQRQAQDMWRVDLEVYGLAVNTLVISSYSRRFILYLPLDILELCESAIGNVVEFGPFWLRSHAG
jgi:hypothetical protein